MRTKPELANFCEAKNPSAHLPLTIQPIQPFSGCLITPQRQPENKFARFHNLNPHPPPKQTLAPFSLPTAYLSPEQAFRRLPRAGASPCTPCSIHHRCPIPTPIKRQPETSFPFSGCPYHKQSTNAIKSPYIITPSVNSFSGCPPKRQPEKSVPPIFRLPFHYQQSNHQQSANAARAHSQISSSAARSETIKPTTNEASANAIAACVTQ